MSRESERSKSDGANLLRRFTAWLAAERGAVSPIMSLMVVPIIGALGMAVETGNWYFTQRSMQNAADTAALAAATNACTTGSCGATCSTQARALAQKYGFVDAVNNVTVTPATTTASPGLWRSEAGTTAVEFTLVLPLLILLSIGAIRLGSMMTMIASLHYAAEDAARCASVRTSCVPSTYGPSRYKGPAITGLAFVLNPAGTTCTNTVRGSGTYRLRTGLGILVVPVSAQACYPSKT